MAHIFTVVPSYRSRSMKPTIDHGYKKDISVQDPDALIYTNL